ncbi:MAG: hypothetical protein ABIC91_07540 [Nanoarchaeota archaeon]|nr:hypothetical protein [Nanoarchaeota archaeon]MBU1850763.1 hypothetical protein [Nanoarchaeota archaeon]
MDKKEKLKYGVLWTIITGLTIGTAINFYSMYYKLKEQKENNNKIVVHTILEEQIKNTNPKDLRYSQLEKELRMNNSNSKDLYELASKGNEEIFRKYKTILKKADLYFIRKMVYHPIQARTLIKTYEKRNGVNKKSGKVVGNGFYSYETIHNKKIKMTCTEAAIIAAATLKDDGYRPLLLFINQKQPKGLNEKELKKWKQNNYDHVVFLYKQNDKYGSIGGNIILENKFSNIETLAREVAEISQITYGSHHVIDLDETGIDWLNHKKFPNIWSILEPKTQKKLENYK